MQPPQKMEQKRMQCDCFEVKNLASSREEKIEGDLKMFWTQLGGRRVDIIFEQVQNVLLSLKEKIKNGTATNQECWQAWALVNEAKLGDLLDLTNVSDMSDGGDTQEMKPKLQHLLTDENIANAVEGSHSNGAESVPVSFCNDLDRARLPYFKYRRASWPRGYYLNNFSSVFVDSCDCTDGCVDRSKCACLQLTERGYSKSSLSASSKTSHGYSYKRLEGPVPSGIYECSVLCRCDKMMCQNRVVQHGIQVRLQVFNTEKKGWAVRCLDDIDKGTFICTYSGRLMSRAELQVLGDAGQELQEKSAMKSRGHGLFSKRRKLDSDCSDSVIEVAQTGTNDALEKHEPLSQTVDNENETTLVHPRNLSIGTSRRPGTRTVVFHDRQLNMEIDTLVHNASSDEDNSSQIHQSSKTKLTSGTKKGKEKSTQQQKEECPMETGQTEPADTDSAECKRKSLSPQGVACGTSGVLDNTCVVRPSKKVPVKADCREENCRQPKQDIFCEEADGDGTLLKNANEENIYVLDASKEGNVGRFLNHSCCPNLFAQSVFVETHNRSFPWVAFFTNRHVKAGTELTWDYGYEPGSMPEAEISCQCGVQKCRKKTL
ncbi:histone-lysine N-methyltransferase SETDB2 isoform X5 [Columba livia]|uniref:histone-lysine N-methyltransferase SETDB2 isoform X5 n=1 Tax=Columba livia TaxID=8932 RepID=UPI0031BB15F9